ncbi:MAG: amylo-alpha-1,6-glucosidase [Verrucomicrobia bacterium]|nr:MAG: amylo-alpha-1,6-glucosidase [Verrucomicrobiota bacterium]
MDRTRPIMSPNPGERLQRFVGDCVRFDIRTAGGRDSLKGWQARLRTNLGRADMLRLEIIEAHTCGLPLAGASWRDLPMAESSDGWSLVLPLVEPGYFKAKAYLLDPRGWQKWPDGPDTGISVHPDKYRTGNVIYCAFSRMFDQARVANRSSRGNEALTKKSETRKPKPEIDQNLSTSLATLDAADYTVIPPSGKLRELTAQLPHIFETLGCRILHLLPVNPTPTTYARFGRFGSPYAALDLSAIDPALVVFDKRTTGVDQFRELTYAVHLRGGSVFLDIVINHTGWGSDLQENHPEWFVRHGDGAFASPGVWGVTWEDLVELKHDNVALWDDLSEVFLTWCRRGVDGFRCDAGYKVPVAAWQYIIARVQQEFPETLFLLEGLGGAWEITEALLTEGGFQWAYSELFQNYSGLQVSGYLDHTFRQSTRAGLLVHYSETHDNERLAARGKEWSLLRNRLCALTSVSGGFGFTCGVEWLATEKIKVHGNTAMRWGNSENLAPELALLNRLLADHPCFYDGSTLKRLSPPDSPIYALLRESQEGVDRVLVLINTDAAQTHSLLLEASDLKQTPNTKHQTPEKHQAPSTKTSDEPLGWIDLLGQVPLRMKDSGNSRLEVTLRPGSAYCLAPAAEPAGLHGDSYRQARARAAWALKAMSHVMPEGRIFPFDWRFLADEVDRCPADFLTRISCPNKSEILPLSGTKSEILFPQVVSWSLLDLRRITPVPPGHWLLIEDTVPFRAFLTLDGVEARARQADPTAIGADKAVRAPIQNVEAVRAQSRYFASFPPRKNAAEATLRLERYTEKDQSVSASVCFLAPKPSAPQHATRNTQHFPRPSDLILLTNGRGAMARLCVDLGRVNSKYDCVLGANLHPTLPVDRHILAKRIRVWINADGFISPLDFSNLASFDPGPPAVWHFAANAGDGRKVRIILRAWMVENENTVNFHFSRGAGTFLSAATSGRPLDSIAETTASACVAVDKNVRAPLRVRLTVRLDIEDRNFHEQTKRNGGADHHFNSHTRTIAAGTVPSPGGRGPYPGFAFTPAKDRQLRVFADSGLYHPQPEWSENIPHSVEQSRGQVGSGDAFSPGWFDLPLDEGGSATLVVTAEIGDAGAGARTFLSAATFEQPQGRDSKLVLTKDVAADKNVRAPTPDSFADRLTRAARQFLVRRDSGKTVIAGYPWFLDWGRDTFICARGLLAAGLIEEVKQLLITFARFEQNGTLPNTIFGENASNRDTSDAPLWFALVCEEMAQLYRDADSGAEAHKFYDTPVDGNRRTLRSVLESIVSNYSSGTPNGIRMDSDSGLIWSPSHFTWMDTNYPACTPREGYPIEIQALWVRLLRQVDRIGGAMGGDKLADRALASVGKLFWREDRGYFADVLLTSHGQPAAKAVADDALRSNYLLAISLGLVTGERARRGVEAARRYLVVPGALRSLAPLPVSVPLPNRSGDGHLLNNPAEPYWGRYEGDEDTRRKPGYHNGTAWTWTFPIFCEALAWAYDFSPQAVSAAKAYLGSMARLMDEGCLGQIPEILDGDAPHSQRGCDAQAWGATEALRVWKLLDSR